jgi:hypothetical protein
LLSATDQNERQGGEYAASASPESLKQLVTQNARGDESVGYRLFRRHRQVRSWPKAEVWKIRFAREG